MTSTKKQLITRLQKNYDHLLGLTPEVYDQIKDINRLYLPDVKSENMEDFYQEIGRPFFHSLTRQNIEHLAKLQNEIWALHQEHPRLIILKSQKIGISSLCILITLWHALTDCRGMDLIINAQSDEQAKEHAQDLRRILSGSKFREYMITTKQTDLGLLKDEVTKIHIILLHNKVHPRQVTTIRVIGMSPGALLSHKKIAFVWSSDMTISEMTPQRQGIVWGAMLSRLAISQGPMIVECPARAPAGPIYEEYERFTNRMENNDPPDPKHEFYCYKFKYERGRQDGFFTDDFLDAEKRRLGPLFGTFYEADFFASGATWYKEEHFKNLTDEATEILFDFHPIGGKLSDLS